MEILNIISEMSKSYYLKQLLWKANTKFLCIFGSSSQWILTVLMVRSSIFLLTFIQIFWYQWRHILSTYVIIRCYALPKAFYTKLTYPVDPIKAMDHLYAPVAKTIVKKSHHESMRKPNFHFFFISETRKFVSLQKVCEYGWIKSWLHAVFLGDDHSRKAR